MSHIKITKSMRKGDEGLAYRIEELLLDEENAELGKKKFTLKMEEIIHRCSGEEKAAAYRILAQDPAVLAHKRAKLVAELLGVTPIETIKTDNVKEMFVKAAKEAAQAIEETLDDMDDGIEPKITLINREKNPLPVDRFENIKAAVAHQIEYRPKIMQSDMIALGWHIGRRFRQLTSVFSH